MTVASVPPGVTADHGARRRAVLLAAVPGVVLAVVLVAALIVPAGPVVAVVVAVVVGAAASGGLWAWSPRLLLRALGARPAAEDRWPRPFGLVEGLCATMGLSAPMLAVVDADVADALAVGTAAGSTTVVVTTGLLERLDPVALEGVLAHELTHVKRGDVALGSVAAMLALPLARLGDPGDLVHRVRGRGCELDTDQRAVAVTRYPPGLRAALATMAATAGPGGSDGLVASPAGRATRWLWTVPLGAPPTGDALIGELDAAEVRMAALDEL